jgi:hypothetical protein
MKVPAKFGLVLAVSLWGLASYALAHEGHGGESQTITGEVVDLACYVGMGESGAGHRDCAQKCIASGLPVGIKSGDTIYLVTGSEHNAANATLAPLAAKTVVAEGQVSERDGVHLLTLKKVTVKE